MRFLLPLLATLIVGCASTPAYQDAYATNPSESEEFGVYVRLFQLEAEKRGVQLSMPNLDRSLRIYKVDNFNEELQKKYVIGLCIKTATEVDIYIDRDSWNSYDSQQRELLLFHELGHCVLDLEHDKSTDSEGLPDDIMFPVNFDSYEYYKYRTFFLDRMFKKVSKKKDNPAPVGETVYTCRWGLKYRKGKVYRDKSGKDQRYSPISGQKF